MERRTAALEQIKISEMTENDKETIARNGIVIALMCNTPADYFILKSEPRKTQAKRMAKNNPKQPGEISANYPKNWQDQLSDCE